MSEGVNTTWEKPIFPEPGSTKVILANTIAKGLLDEVKKGLQEVKWPTRPKLVGFLANNDEAAVAYADYTAKTCAEK